MIDFNAFGRVSPYNSFVQRQTFSSSFSPVFQGFSQSTSGSVQFPAGGGIPQAGSSEMVQSLLLMKLLSRLFGGSDSIQNTAAVTTPETPVIPDPSDAERAQLLTEADGTLQGGLFNDDDLAALKGKTAKQQYQETVKRAYGGAQLANGKKKTTKRMVKDGTWKYNDWNLEDLNKELGSAYGTMAKSKMKLKNINATSDTNATWHSTPFHMSQAQKYLDEAKKLEAFIQSRGGSVSSSASSSGSVSSSSVFSDLEAKAKELRQRAGLHFQVAKTTMSPVIMDTDGNGKIDLTSVKNGVRFDLDGDGKKEQVAWTAAKGKDTDSWLSLDRNGNGQIDSGKELFGNQHGKANGYDELKQFDDNHDGIIDRQDVVYQKLKMWQDRNHDGISQADEMVSLDKAGVESVNLSYTQSKAQDAFGNELRQQSNFKRTDDNARAIAQKQGVSFEAAKTGLALDAWLQLSKAV